MQRSVRYYRSFLKVGDTFFKVMPWLFLAGVLVFISMSIIGWENVQGGVGAILLWLTIVPCILGWLLINGVHCVWRAALDKGREGTLFRRGFLYVVGFAFLVCFFYILRSLLAGLLGGYEC